MSGEMVFYYSFYHHHYCCYYRYYYYLSIEQDDILMLLLLLLLVRCFVRCSYCCTECFVRRRRAGYGLLRYCTRFGEWNCVDSFGRWWISRCYSILFNFILCYSLVFCSGVFLEDLSCSFAKGGMNTEDIHRVRSRIDIAQPTRA